MYLALSHYSPPLLFLPVPALLEIPPPALPSPTSRTPPVPYVFCRPQLFKRWIAFISIWQINFQHILYKYYMITNCIIHLEIIKPVDSVIHLSNNWGLSLCHPVLPNYPGHQRLFMHCFCCWSSPYPRYKESSCILQEITHNPLFEHNKYSKITTSLCIFMNIVLPSWSEWSIPITVLSIALP